jgi:hypothetical protein
MLIVFFSISALQSFSGWVASFWRHFTSAAVSAHASLGRYAGQAKPPCVLAQNVSNVPGVKFLAR